MHIVIYSIVSLILLVIFATLMFTKAGKIIRGILLGIIVIATFVLIYKFFHKPVSVKITKTKVQAIIFSFFIGFLIIAIFLTLFFVFKYFLPIAHGIIWIIISLVLGFFAFAVATQIAFWREYPDDSTIIIGFFRNFWDYFTTKDVIVKNTIGNKTLIIILSFLGYLFNSATIFCWIAPFGAGDDLD
ncbi:hypothetical protein [Metamycoplasma auris]|uniref:Uncharacterized protein n=1 Tax=Metamycoplasma auris TaxID=51363 RepID=A0A2W7FWS6_9BACT|nr:hypothetical protein [Metamycoplasma auris]PZV98731.1 hypothetical protein BCF89_11211 [Metamycoplasma auris]